MDPAPGVSEQRRGSWVVLRRILIALFLLALLASVAKLLTRPVVPIVEVRMNTPFRVYPDGSPLPLARDGEWHVRRFHAGSPGMVLESPEEPLPVPQVGLPRIYESWRQPVANVDQTGFGSSGIFGAHGGLAVGVASFPDESGGGALVPYFDVVFHQQELPTFGALLRADGVHGDTAILGDVRIHAEVLDIGEYSTVDRLLGRPTIFVEVSFPPASFDEEPLRTDSPTSGE